MKNYLIAGVSSDIDRDVTEHLKREGTNLFNIARNLTPHLRDLNTYFHAIDITNGNPVELKNLLPATHHGLPNRCCMSTAVSLH